MSFFKHWDHNKMVDILQTPFCNFLKDNFHLLIQTSLKLVFERPIHKEHWFKSLVPDRHKPVPEPLMIQFTNMNMQPGLNDLKHWGRGEMAASFQTTFSNTFSWMKMYEFHLIFHWSLFLRFKLTTFQHWFRKWLGADQATSHCLNQWWSVY